MPKVNRCLEPGALFHVVNRGVEKRDIFLDDEDRLKFVTLLKELYKHFRCRVVAYCLMGNHFHLVLLDPKCELSKAIRDLCARYARSFNLRHFRDGTLFRGRFKSVKIVTEDQFLSTIEYVHLNPLKDGFTETPAEWPWSSYNAYLNPKKFPKWMVHFSSVHHRKPTNRI